MANLSILTCIVKRKERKGISFHPGKFYKLFHETVSVRKKKVFYDVVWFV